MIYPGASHTPWLCKGCPCPVATLPKSCQPDPDGGEQNKAEKVDRRLLVTCRHTAITLDFAEEILHKMTFLVGMPVNVSLAFPCCGRRDNRGHPLFFDSLDDVVGVVALVSDEVLPLCLFDKSGGFADVVDVSGGKVDMQGVTKSVHKSMDFGGIAAARAANSLNLGPPFPPAASWWALA